MACAGDHSRCLMDNLVSSLVHVLDLLLAALLKKIHTIQYTKECFHKVETHYYCFNGAYVHCAVRVQLFYPSSVDLAPTSPVIVVVGLVNESVWLHTTVFLNHV